MPPARGSRPGHAMMLAPVPAGGGTFFFQVEETHFQQKHAVIRFG